ncbi:sigma-70 family RNA polymerase sigma factor [Streptomyces sp. NPDC050485]|uniref:sigma-70 family RNA polymerase sigma factor n=1 Tax=Streptomyces sp. NPDC050485 TaxID=3365617 RepID=UPI0037BB7FF9
MPRAQLALSTGLLAADLNEEDVHHEHTPEAHVSDEGVLGDVTPQSTGHDVPVLAPLDLPLDFEGFYLGHQEFFHAYAEIHLGARRAAEDVVHQVFPGDPGRLGRTPAGKRTGMAHAGRPAPPRLRTAPGGGTQPAFVINGPIAQNLRAVRNELELTDSANGLYEAIAELPVRQFNVIVLRHLLGYKTSQIARFMGLDVRTVDYHGRNDRDL